MYRRASLEDPCVPTQSSPSPPNLILPLHNTILRWCTYIGTQPCHVPKSELLTLVNSDTLDKVSRFLLHSGQPLLKARKSFTLLVKDDNPSQLGKVIHNEHEVLTTTKRNLLHWPT
eukprot:c20001_g2_i1 orf=1505-1852(-)